MDAHRLVPASSTSIETFARPFSSFDYVDRIYGESSAIRRLFSLARSHDSDKLLIEHIEPEGIIADENDEIKSIVPDYQMGELHRISFWRSNGAPREKNESPSEQLVGYAILKHDLVPSLGHDMWHVFESVFEKYRDPHNCVPNPYPYIVSLGGQNITIKGLLYAQQNSLNKSCAHVALRSLISRILNRDISYREINNFARQAGGRFNPKGLNVKQIRSVLDGFGVPFRDRVYTHNILGYAIRKSQPYQSYVYAGVESGMGALVGFRLSGKGKHIIPFYGHTFNKDTWAPDAEIAYFRVGKNLQYISSQNWTSSFLGHDDNFGANFCIPRLYIPPNKVDYVVELLKQDFVIRGAQAEGLALQFLYSVIDTIDVSINKWLLRLAQYTLAGDNRQVILRAIAVDRSIYIQHLRDEKDWEGNFEDPRTVDFFEKSLPHSFWVVEMSIPQLFPANERKLGDIVIDGQIDFNSNEIYRHLLYIRLPGGYYMLQDPLTMNPRKSFQFFPSNLVSHLNVIRLN